jgi:hypothetical protein
MTGHDAETVGHDQPKCAVIIGRNVRSRSRNRRSRWAEIRTYHESWGRPLSLRRLHRMQSHLHWLLRFQGADARKAVAREHWRQDLAWIRTVLGPMVAGPGLTPVKWAGRQDG